MAPRKILSDPTTDKKVKITTNRRVTREKSKFKTPARIKITIPVSNTTLNTTDLMKNTIKYNNQRHLDSKTKLELANEVAQAQLVKSEHLILGPEPKPVMARKKGRPKKIISDYFKPSIVDINENGVQGPVTKTPKRLLKRKLPEANEENKLKPGPKERIAVPAEKKKRKLSETKLITTTKTTRKGNGNKTPVRRSSRRKGKPDDKSQEQSPSILDQFNLTPKKEIDINPPIHEVVSASPKIIDEKLLKTEIETKAAGPIVSRKTSINSNSSLSWTKDISSLSTATCITVSSNDFVRFDKKLPILKLTNIDHTHLGVHKSSKTIQRNTDVALDTKESSSSESDTTSSDSEHSNNATSGKSLNLSVTSCSKTQSSVANVDDDDKDGESACDKAVKQLVSTIKNVDWEVINWFSFDKDDITADLNRLKDKMFDIWNSEFNIITGCQHLKEVFNSENVDSVVEEGPPVETNQETDFVKPCSKAPDEIKRDISFKVNTDRIIDKLDKVPTVASEGIVDNNHGYMSSDHYDDDDALSLYAESIIGIESSKVNISNASTSNVEEYIPQSVKTTFVTPERYNYCPSKIEEIQNIKTKNVCEKQNADSTSKPKEVADKNENVSLGDPNEKPAGSTSAVEPVASMSTQNMASLFKPIPVTSSVVLRDVCIFNLIKKCKNDNTINQTCRFPHIQLDVNIVKNRLLRVNEELFIQEYMLVRNWPKLWRCYGMCFVAECARRQLTRILLEMTIDFITKAKPQSLNDAILKMSVAEVALLHLNDTGFPVCEDLLQFSIEPELQLCDVFMRTIAETQNFSQFKSVFLSLTAFMVKIGRTFMLDVASSILERVCILPFEESLASAVLQIMKCCDARIFEHPMIRKFETQISSNAQIHKEYWSLKTKFTDIAATSESRPKLSLNTQLEPPARGPEEDNTPHAPSPDTTNLDNMTKKPDEPVVTQTIEFNRARQFNFSVPPPAITRPRPPAVHNRRVIMRGVQKWRHKNGYSKRKPYPNSAVPFRPMGHMQRPKLKQRVGHSPRRPGPKY